MSSTKPRVVVVSVTGNNGRPVAEGLVKSGKFEVIGTARPASAKKPEVKQLQSIGVDVRFIEWNKATAEELEALFKGVDTVISTVNFEVINEQPKLIDAAKAAGVKRFVSGHWGIVCTPERVLVEATKREIDAYAEKVGQPYTSIATGFWDNIIFPAKALLKEGEKPLHPFQLPHSYGPGNVKNAVVDLKLLGEYVPYIIEDPRTINRIVLAHHDEVTVDEAWALGDKYASYNPNEARIRIPDEQVEAGLLSGENLRQKLFNQLLLSAYILGENNVEGAKKQGFLIAKELYPEVKVPTAEQIAKEYYSA